MKPYINIITVTLVGFAFIQCARSSAKSEEVVATNSVVAARDAVDTTPLQVVAKALSVIEINYPLDSLRSYANEDELVGAFGRQNVLSQDGGVLLFPGTDHQVAFDKADGINFSMIKVNAPAIWHLKNGLKIGMPISEVVELNGSGFSFKVEGGYSGAAGGTLQSGYESWGFEVPQEIKNKYKDWIGWDDLEVEERSKVKIGYIYLYYEDQSEGD